MCRHRLRLSRAQSSVLAMLLLASGSSVLVAADNAWVVPGNRDRQIRRAQYTSQSRMAQAPMASFDGELQPQAQPEQLPPPPTQSEQQMLPPGGPVNQHGELPYPDQYDGGPMDGPYYDGGYDGPMFDYGGPGGYYQQDWWAQTEFLIWFN